MKVQIKNYEFETSGDNSFWQNIEKWEPETFTILDKFLNKDNVLVDVGAWNGVVSMYGAKICKHVYSFEPSTSSYIKMLENLSLSGIINVTAFNCGCYTEYINQKVYTTTHGDSTNSVIDRDMPEYKSVDYFYANFVKLSDYIKKMTQDPIGLIKMDIEGGEIYVLEEMHDYIKEHHPNMYISFHPNWFPEKEKNIERIIEIIFDGYKVLNTLLQECDKETLRQGLFGHSHSYVLIKE